ncbi:MAG: hypothetical protein IT359_02110 [Gemmatimonadaceae bacterium]|nr:hypothetical protein [Gemmatimonadaceae bacterium]
MRAVHSAAIVTWCLAGHALPAWSQGVLARDSAGVAVRHYARTAAAPTRWRLGRTPILRIGGAGDTKSDFSGVRGVVRLKDGQVIVADGGALELRVFDARGRFLRAFGRRGTGPGELDGMSQVTRVGDTIVVSDFQGRVHAWTPDGTLRQSRGRMPVASLTTPVWMGQLGGRVDVFVGAPEMFQSWTGDEILTVPLVVRDSVGSSRTIASIPAFEVANVNGRQMPVYLGPAARMAINANDVCVAWSKEWLVTCYDANGKARWRTTRNVPLGSLADSDKEAFRENFRQGNRATPPDRREAIVRAFQFARNRPAISRIELSRSGELWIGEWVIAEELQLGQPGFTVPDRATIWSILGRDGAWLADVELPERFRLLEAGSDYVAGVIRDEDDVESVVVYHIVRGGQ